MWGWKQQRGRRSVRNISDTQCSLSTAAPSVQPGSDSPAHSPSCTALFWFLQDEAYCIGAGISWQPQGFQQGSACCSPCSPTCILQKKREKLQMILLCRQKKLHIATEAGLQSCWGSSRNKWVMFTQAAASVQQWAAQQRGVLFKMLHWNLEPGIWWELWLQLL